MGNDTKDAHENLTAYVPGDFSPDPETMRYFLSINISMRAADMTSNGATDEARKDRDSKRTRERARAAMSTNISKLIAETALSLAAIIPAGGPDAPDGQRVQYRDVLERVTEDLQDRQRALDEFICSDKWKKIKAVFPPDLADEDAGLFFFSGAYIRIYELLPDLKKQFAKYEEETGERLTFAALTDVYGTREPPLNKFMRAIEREYEEEGPGTRADKEKTLRTATKAGAVDQIVAKLATVTAPDFLNAFNLISKGKAYMQLISMDGLKFEDGKLYFTDERARAVSEAELQDLRTREGIDTINLPFLQFCYSVIFKNWETAIYDRYAKGGSGAINPIVTFYLPDLATARGLPRNASGDSIRAIQKDIESFHNVVGVIKYEGYKEPSRYPVLLFEGYDATKNTVSLSSPYLLHVVKEIYSISVRRTKDGKPRLRNDGTPHRLAVNSYLIHSDIIKERNKAAVQNVSLFVQGIERRGGTVGKDENGQDLEYEYHISLKTLIELNPILGKQLEDKAHRAQTLSRCFKTTWQLLRTKTDLLDAYKDIILPDPKNPADIPTAKEIESRVFYVNHKGKYRQK